jgi:hypothetical protein
MTSRKLVTLIAAALVTVATLATASPTPDPRGVHRVTLLLPAGHVLQGRAVGGEWTLSAVSPEAAASALAGPRADQGTRKECENDVPGEGWYTWYSVSTLDPLGGPNVASEGGCVPQSHTGPVNLMQFRTAGDYYGSVFATGCAETTGLCGSYQVSCTPVGAAIGAPGASGWGTILSGRDMTCVISTRGTQPHEWESWDASVGNAHSPGGSAYAFFV